MNIWQTLKNKITDENIPIFALAPMEDVTDTVFRQIIIKTAKPDIFYTEFMSVEGFASEKGRNKVAKRLRFTTAEKPLIAQIWGVTPASFEFTAKELVKLGFDGIDINMGCPQKKIVKTGGCAKLIGNYKLSKDIIEATLNGTQGEIPISVKTRLGYSTNIINEWASFLLEQPIAELTVHGRNAIEMSEPPANWEEIAKVVKIKNKIAPDKLTLGNGDVISYQDGLEKQQKYGVDGVMVGRGIFRNPWLFNPTNIDPSSKSRDEKIELLKLHIDLYQATWKNNKPLHNLRHYFKIYLNGFERANELRQELMNTDSYKELYEILNKVY